MHVASTVRLEHSTAEARAEKELSLHVQTIYTGHRPAQKYTLTMRHYRQPGRVVP